MEPSVLITPLDWGLGHATRCMPVIDALVARGVRVGIASSGSAARLLREEYPALAHHDLPAYGLRYPTKQMVWNVAIQSPRWLSAMVQERRVVGRLVRRFGYGAVVSDNRYGSRARGVHNVLITHQVRPLIPGRPLRWMAHRILFRWYRQFDEIWIPDVPGTESLSGELSNTARILNLPVVRHLGVLSRMHPMNLPQRWDVIAVLSGPEPQRSILEEEILAEALRNQGRWLVVQGLPGRDVSRKIAQRIEIVSHLQCRQLNEAIAASGFFVGRSGYSTIMDLVSLRKPALLIPTPGQTEQIYLACRLGDKGYFLRQLQGQLDVGTAILEGKKIRAAPPDIHNPDRLLKAVNALVGRLWDGNGQVQP